MLVQLVGLAGVPVIVGLVQVLKRAWPELRGRWVPLLSLGLGLALNVWAGWYVGLALPEALAVGLVAGLSASGLYSQGKTFIEGTKKGAKATARKGE